MNEMRIVRCVSCGAVIGDDRHCTIQELNPRKYCERCFQNHRKAQQRRYNQAYRRRKKAEQKAVRTELELTQSRNRLLQSENDALQEKLYQMGAERLFPRIGRRRT